MKAQQKPSLIEEEYSTKFIDFSNFKRLFKMTLSQEVTKRIIKKLISGEDYRIEIVTLLMLNF
jgi:hypothetical protein